MPLFTVIVWVIAATSAYAQTSSITAAYPDDTIKVLWWALGILGSVVTTMWGGVGVWMIKKIMDHDKDIVAIKTKCSIEHGGDDE